MAERVTFASKDGSEVGGVIALPLGGDKAPGVVLLQEWWGLNDHIKTFADRFAAAGFVTLAPDLYHGKVTADPDEAGKLMQALDRDRALRDIEGAVRHLLANARCNGKVGVTGFCMGGAFTISAAATIPEVSAAVPFYGVPPADKTDYKKLTAPIMGHFATRDQWASVAAAEGVKKALEAHGRSMQIHVYEADHAFANDTRPDVYNPEAARLAFDRTVAFLRHHLDTPGAAAQR
jgi:carboxymethylenebutenolidase